MKIRVYPDPVLRIKRIIREMKETMHMDEGIGLAANQVGITKKIMTIDFEDFPEALINPEIVSQSEETDILEEGCLSFPELNVPVERPIEVTVKYIDENSQKQQRTFKELYARVFMHEYDHLTGRLIIDYLSPDRQLKYNMNLHKKEIL